jgi:serine O-acetyltransferase
MTSRDYIQHKASVMGRALDDLRPTYECGDGWNPIRGCEAMPSESEVLRVLALLDDVFYPGYRTELPPGEPIETLVIERLDEAYDTLYRQVKRALPRRWSSEYALSLGEAGPKPLNEAELTEEAERVVCCFFERLPQIREQLKKDIIAAYNGDPAARSYSEVILSYPGARAITKHRIAHELYRLAVPLIPRIISEYIHSQTGIEIHPGARIGRRVVIDHGMGVVIGETAEVADDVLIYQGVTLGGNRLTKEKRHPTIGSRVVLGIGSTVLGNIEVGDDARVGAGAVVTHPVESGSTVVGVPAHPIHLKRPAPVPMPNLEHADLSDPVAEAMAVLLERVERLEAELHILRGVQHSHGNGASDHEPVLEKLVRDSTAG